MLLSLRLSTYNLWVIKLFDRVRSNDRSSSSSIPVVVVAVIVGVAVAAVVVVKVVSNIILNTEYL